MMRAGALEGYRPDALREGRIGGKRYRIRCPLAVDVHLERRAVHGLVGTG